MTVQQIHIDPVGPVTFSQTRRARRLSITIAPFKGVRVSFPMRISLRTARRYLRQHMDWVLKTVGRMRQIEIEHTSTLGAERMEVDEAEVRQILLNRLEELASEHGFRFNRVFFRRQKTRWGSCSESNNINLNLNLMQLRPELIDYVLLHELTHTKIKNHSRQFWDELSRVLGTHAKAVDRELRKHRLGQI